LKTRLQVIAQSREKYGTPKEIIEDKISRWSSQTYSDSGNRSLRRKDENSDEQKE